MIVGGHITIASSNPEADMRFFRDLLKLPNVDAGGGYIIFGLPPCEVAVHGGEEGHTLYLMCENMDKFLTAIREQGIEASDPQNQSWGVMTEITLPGGDTLHVYEPAHKHPPAPKLKAARKPAPKTKKRVAKKAPQRKAKKAKKRAGRR